jgi:Zn finger protein HypA/HybF involved in hydrogenase expression
MGSEQSAEKVEAVAVDVGEAATITATAVSAVVSECVTLFSFFLATNCD